MGAGPSHPAGQQQAFITSTKSLDVWLDQRNFRYSLHAIQRGYEWQRPQVVNLLDTVAKVMPPTGRAEAHGAAQGDAVVKLSEVVLLQDESRNMQALFQGETWYLRTGDEEPRIVEIIDGQQRITTLVIIAAVVQHMLLDLAKKMPHDQPVKQRALEAVKELEARFAFEVGGSRQILLSRQGGDGGLDGGMFSFEADGDRLLAEELTKKPAGHRHRANAIHTFNWFSEQLGRLAGPKAREAAATTPDMGAKQSEWLLAFLDTLATRVVWTTTLTHSRRLALDTFLNVNLDSHRVTLSEADVIKVALMSDLGRQRDLTPALGFWKKCVTELRELAGNLQSEDTPYLSFLSKVDPTGVSAPALVKDWLRHVCAIEKAVDGIALAVCDTDGGLAQHFAARRGQSAHWEPQRYIQGTLLQYAWAFCTMLTGKVHSELGKSRLLLATQASLVTLLSLPDSTWRPAAVAIIREICRDGAPMRETTFPAQKLLADVLKQLEFVALRLTTSGRPAARVPTYMAIIKASVAAGARNDADRHLRAALGDGALCRLAFDTMESLPKVNKLVGGGISLIRDLYIKDQYKDRYGGKLALAVLLSVESSKRLQGVRDGGYVARWEGKISVEHLLPQNPRNLDPYWRERFGEPKGPTHTTFLHKLGNLAILSQADNSKLSDNGFDAKLLMMDKLKLDYRTLDMVMERKCWGMGNILERHRWLLERLAERFDIIVPESSWTQWQEELLKGAGHWQQLTGGQELLRSMGVPDSGDVAGGSSGTGGGTGVGGPGGSGAKSNAPSCARKRKHQEEEPRKHSTQVAPGAHQPGAAGSAAAAGGPEPADPEAADRAGAQPLSEAPELSRTPREIVNAALAGSLEPEIALQLLRSVSRWRLPLSTKAPLEPRAGQLYLFDTRETRYYKTDGHRWKKRPKGGWMESTKSTTLVDEDVLVKTVTLIHENGTLKRCIYYLEFSIDANEPVLASYKLVHYVPM